MSIPSSIAMFWDAFCAELGEDGSDRFFEAFHFDDNEATANELADLVLAGVKRATAGLVWSFENAGGSPPKPGALSVVTYWDGRPACVIETLQVEVLPFDQVTAEFAAIEGEGDASLEYWRRVHWAYFGRECARMGREPSLTMPVACERFNVIYRGKA
ncbi:ASCH domain-containing protein [Variovorax sp. WS11]|uniref:ASCH domain-containing protein n=1 Tax=Variovorax sp. WS11 TaxID=1105204 RepID=UPI000D0D4501|nr:ASCH domain-containing protein [Variovorax sp. WS11]NDZ18298.1 ASCH domain-containing protein [Variovorax sp. WS11]PSL84298.1 ASCH domain-containing protein [Variovorax sp. WS11]